MSLLTLAAGETGIARIVQALRQAIQYLNGQALTGVAGKSDQQTGTGAVLAVTPVHQQDHDSAAKAWVEFNSAGAILASYNVASVTKNSTGDFTIAFATAFASANYACFAMARGAAAANAWMQLDHLHAPTTSAARILCLNSSAFVDPDSASVVCFGRQ
jgi:hypothetical protein